MLTADPWSRFRREVGRLDDFLHICHEGSGYVEHAEQVIDVLSKSPLSPFPNEESRAAALTHAARLRSFAESEGSKDFSYAFRLGVVMLWSLTEALATDLAQLRLVDSADAWRTERMQKLKGNIGPFVHASREEQARVAIDLLDRDLGSSNMGVERFEGLLHAVGVGGSVDDVVKEALVEFSQVRNACVHNGAIADTRLIRVCPWLGLKPGEEVVVTGAQFHKYRTAALWYSIELWERFIRVSGQASGESFDKLLKMKSTLGTTCRSMHRRHTFS